MGLFLLFLSLAKGIIKPYAVMVVYRSPEANY